MKTLCATCLGMVLIVFGMSSTALSWKCNSLLTQTEITRSITTSTFLPMASGWAYDTRAFSGGIRNTLTLEKVNIDTKEIVVIHEVADPVVDLGPGTGAVSYFPAEDKVVAIHGLPTSTGLKYEGFRRFGAIFSPTDGTADIVVADARDVTDPLTPGALRGGSHRHEPSGDGQWIGFTYNDMIMRDLGNDLRTIGVTKLGTPVSVDMDPAGENQDGIGFSVLVAKVTPRADIVPDSDAIYQASNDSWVGDYGYDLGDGTMQRARAFIGRTMVSDGIGGVVERREVYIMDIPEDITVAGPDGPLEGAATSFPMPPAGTVQRRLTFSDSNCGGIVRSSRDGSQIAFS
jgi:hypothetical protein